MVEIPLQVFLNGLTIGAIYGLMAIGLSLIFSVVGIANSAHGGFYLLGAYVAYFFQSIGLSVPLAMLLAILVVGGVGVVVYRLTIHPILSLHENVLILTFLLAIVFEQIIRITFGPEYKNLKPLVTGVFEWGGIVMSNQRITAAVLSVILVYLLSLFIERTRLGKAIRMTTQDNEAAQLLGIDVMLIYLLTFGLGSALTAASAVLAAPLFTLYPAMGWLPFILSFFITISGGLGSVSGALVMGIVFGLTDAFVSYYIAPTWGLIAGFVLTLIILIVKPQGLLGR
jgi:branched-chain amino acid transport system permease protein